MSIRFLVAASAVIMGVAAFACGGPAPDGSNQESTSAAASCSPSPTPSCSPGYELVQGSSSTTYGQSGAGLEADGFADDFCSFVRWFCRRKSDPVTPPCTGGAPTSCPAATCWVDEGGDFCTQYSCSGVQAGSPPNESGGYIDETTTNPKSFCKTN